MDIPPLSPVFYRPLSIDHGIERPGVAAVAGPQVPATVAAERVAPVGESDKASGTDQHRSGSDLPGDQVASENFVTGKATAGNEGEHKSGVNDQEEWAELQKIRELQHRDREVRAHEAAHAAVGGHLTGAPSYSYERGPDGVNYAVSGEVSVASPSVTGDPATTLQQAEQVQRAALAPANPSPQDLKVAAEAARAAAEARLQLMQLDREKVGGETQGKSTSSEHPIGVDESESGVEGRRQAIRAYQSGADQPSPAKGIDTRV